MLNLPKQTFRLPDGKGGPSAKKFRPEKVREPKKAAPRDPIGARIHNRRMSMAEKINDGGPAFPNPYFNNVYGMSLRDWFAGQAMSAIVAKHGVMSCCNHIPSEEQTERKEIWLAEFGGDTPDISHIGTAVIAYEIADALLAAREVQSK